MALRQFTDDGGYEWTVYDVIPRPDERRSHDRRDSGSVSADDPQDRRGEDRRATVSARSTRIKSGWLCFEAGSERRRLQPIPDKWHLMSDAELTALMRQARVAPRRTNPGQGASASRS